ncbi:MAG: sensor histidine kinase [Umezawaea sp.]
MSLVQYLPHAWFAATFGLLLPRKRYPVAVIALTGTSTWLYYVTGHVGPLVLAPALAVFSLARTSAVARRRWSAEQERLRIAREVHDVVAHSLAMINVQAGVAAHVADRKPEEAVKALLAIKEASRAALEDLRATLGVLRSGEGTTPVPSLRRLAELVDPVGKPIAVEGDPGDLPAPVDTAAYRIVQESVTNALRYAPDATLITIRFERTDEHLELRVTDDGQGGMPSVGAGSGLAGMRERAEALGGELHAGGLPGGGFEVRAVLPLRGESSDQSGAGRRPGPGQGGFSAAAGDRGWLRGRGGGRRRGRGRCGG